MNTTISISKETREILRDFGKKSETYDEVIKRMYNSVKMREMLEQFVDKTKWCTIEEAMAWTEKKNREEDAGKNKNNSSKRTKK